MISCTTSAPKAIVSRPNAAAGRRKIAVEVEPVSAISPAASHAYIAL